MQKQMSEPGRAVTRRRFVKTGAGVAAGLVATAPHILESGTVNQESQVRLAWIGVGSRGTSLLTSALNNVSNARLRVSAICDIDERAMNRGIKRCGAMKPVGIKDYRKLLDMKDIDAVFIATPIYLHAEMAIAACEAKRNTYCEKPLAPKAEEVKAVYEAVKKSGIRFQVGFQWRYHVVWQETIKKVQAGEIGKIQFISAHRHVGGYPTRGWYVDRNLSGDLIVEQAVHEMNIFQWLMKGPPLRAAGFGGINALKGVPKERSIMDHYSVTYQFPEDVDLSYSHCVYTTGKVGGLKQIVMGNQTAADLVTGTLYKKGKEIKGDFPSIPNATEQAIVSFVDCVRNDKEPLANVEAGRNATLMAIMGRTAIHEKRVVEWEDVAL